MVARLVRDQKVAGSNPVTSMEAPVNDSDVGLQESFRIYFGRPFKKRIKEIRHALKPFRIASRNNHKNGEKEFEWPGTVTWTDGSLSLIHADVYRLAPEVEAYILSADDLFSWMYPERPEDISFFYKGKCWIDTTAHEEYCNIYDHEPEMARLIDSIGDRIRVLFR